MATTVYIIDTITIAGIEVHIISKDNDDGSLTTYITNDLDSCVPIGLVVFVPGFNGPKIYFDELECPAIFPNFGENMYRHSLNWLDSNSENPQDNAFLRTVIRNTIDTSHRILNQLIISFQDAANEQFLQEQEEAHAQDQAAQEQEAQEEDQEEEAQDQNDIYAINYDDINIIRDNEQVYNEYINNLYIIEQPLLFDIEV
jgi:NACalpha-BTF3-like transcription factor